LVVIGSFTEPAAFRETTGDILRGFRASKKVPGCERIYTCGEKEHLAWLDRLEKGALINGQVRADLVAMRDELGLRQYRFDFE
jgi:LDH2 family malate/lactate/ureidoglycolate dehydrogenase